MDKLNLDLDDLEVDSFQANPEREDKPGTVRGNDPEVTDEIIGPTIPTFPCGETCGLSCGGTCGVDTCANGCDPCPTDDECPSDVICRA